VSTPLACTLTVGYLAPSLYSPAPIPSPSISQDSDVIEAADHLQPYNATYFITSQNTVIDNTSTPTQRDKKASYLKLKIKSYLLSMLALISERVHKPPYYDDFVRIVHVEIQDLGATSSAIAHHGVVMIDPQCPKNLMGRKFAALFGRMLQPDTSYPILTTVIGEDINSVGILEARWHFKDVENSRLHSDPTYYHHVFEVLESWDSSFDLIIGLETIRELGILKTNRRIAAPSFRRMPPSVDSMVHPPSFMLVLLTFYEETTTAREQLQAEEKRRQEETRMKNHEEEKVMTPIPKPNHANGPRQRLPPQPNGYSAANS